MRPGWGCGPLGGPAEPHAIRVMAFLVVLGLVSCHPLQDRVTRAPASPIPLEDIAHLRCAHIPVSLPQWQAEQRDRLYPPENRITWMWPTDGAARAVAVLVHGLNNKPTVMNPLAGVLNAAGVAVLRVTLQGHDCLDLHALQAVRIEDWLYDALRALCVASQYARAQGLPLYYVGYSVGGSLLVDLLQRTGHEDIQVDKMILFAPGIALQPWSAAAVRLAGFLQHIPLLAHWAPYLPIEAKWAEYRCHQGTPLVAYGTRRHSIDHVAQVGLAGLAHIPTLVFIDPRDELVSAAGLRELRHTDNLHAWHIVEVHKPDAPHHLIIDQASVGQAQWQNIVTCMQCHLFGCPAQLVPQGAPW
jgi:esterase/lipase